MSKSTTIRKKALDLVRQQDWPNAIKEYRRLVEQDQNNPNVHNELADIYLKTNQKNEAYESFVQAIDEYTRVGLFNNAVAVCKKVLRVLPARVEVLNKLGLIRMRQGLAKEAESYYIAFLDKAAGGSFESEAFLKLAGAIVQEMPNSTAVLQKLAQCLLGYRLNEQAADTLIKLYLLQQKNGDTSGCEDTRALVTKLGVVAKLDAIAGAQGKSTDRTVVTEDTLWTNKHTEGERIDVESTPRFVPPNSPGRAPANQPPKEPTTAPAPQPAGAVSGGPSERDQWLLRLARGVGGGAPKSKVPAPAETPAPAASAEVPAAAEPEAAGKQPPTFAASIDLDDAGDDSGDAALDDVATAVVTEETPVDIEDETAPEVADEIEDEEPVEEESELEDADDNLEDDMPPIPDVPAHQPAAVMEKNAPRAAASPPPAKEPGMQISALIGDDNADLSGEEDYRSHYDLGMAYIEMDLLSEAIREYQIASKSPQFQVKCLEMIGVCFLKQNQPQLAIRQLTKGLSLLDSDSDESMGIKYNLGLAYEMIGDTDKARTHFEDVYVVDVSFREVAEKIRKLSG